MKQTKTRSNMAAGQSSDSKFRQNFSSCTSFGTYSHKSQYSTFLNWFLDYFNYNCMTKLVNYIMYDTAGLHYITNSCHAYY